MTIDDCCIVVTTVADQETARRLAHIVIDRRLAACAQWFGIASAYHWKGKVHNEPEVLVQFKTVNAAAAALQQCIREQHSYETPEIIVLPITAGLPEYLDWIRSETRV